MHGRKRLPEIYLGTTDKFLAAHRFYEKNGFKRIQPELLPTQFPKMKVDSRFYRLMLGIETMSGRLVAAIGDRLLTALFSCQPDRARCKDSDEKRQHITRH